MKNWHLKKTKKTAHLNGFISKARANSESKLTFLESSLTRLFFACSIYVGTRQGGFPGTTPVPLLAAARAQGVNDDPVKDLNFLFFV